jgi:PIN domain nuclease of toxin-antitoxin system
MGRSLLILLDTHVVIWLASDDRRVSSSAKAAIDETRQAGSGLAISDFTLYEVSLFFRKKQIGLVITLESFLSEVEQRFVVLPITGQVCVSALSLPASYPKDPADRIIGATALVRGIPLVTADRQIRKSRAFPTIW